LHRPDSLPFGQSAAQLLASLAQNPHYNTLVNISLDLRLPEAKALSPIRSGHLLAIVNEALANIVRHAHASSVKIQARDLGEELQILIKDDGVGLVPDMEPGYGIRNIRDRSRLLNGEIGFSAPSGKGTTITLRLPWVD
jgi:two-component system sensor histidine kinase UhpB